MLHDTREFHEDLARHAHQPDRADSYRHDFGGLTLLHGVGEHDRRVGMESIKGLGLRRFFLEDSPRLGEIRFRDFANR